MNLQKKGFASISLELVWLYIHNVVEANGCVCDVPVSKQGKSKMSIGKANLFNVIEKVVTALQKN